jgi:hypothetical protein
MFGDCISIAVVSVVATTTISTVTHTIIDGTCYIIGWEHCIYVDTMIWSNVLHVV